MSGENGVLETVDVLIRARYPILLIETHEEERAEGLLAEIARRRAKELLCWSVSRGLRPYTPNPLAIRPANGGARDPLHLLEEIMERIEPAIFVLEDFHPYLKDSSIVRKLRELAQVFKSSWKTLVLLSPRVEVPMELEKDVTPVDFPLPDRAAFDTLLDSTIREVNEKTSLAIDAAAVPRDGIVQAALGLTLPEAENVLARTIVQRGGLTEAGISDILAEKKLIVRRAGLLEFIDPTDRFDEIGGLEELKEWLRKRRIGFSEEARVFGLPYPRGVLLIGVQGCGKSLCAKAVAGLWGLPLLRFDVGRVYASAVGSSEENIRRAIQCAESVAPAVLWIDEVEKAFAGVQSSAFSDAGTSARVFGTFITWLQEKRSPVFVIATANDVSLLPPELFRKGRFDEIFFVDLPGREERSDILRIHLERRGRPSEGIALDALARESEGFSGAELEEAVVSSLFDAFDERRDLTSDGLVTSLRRTVPLSRTVREKIEDIRAWAEGRARPASRRGKPAGGGSSRISQLEPHGASVGTG